ncbi:hypothetical protein DFH07DRAFT_972224 [Mycena maculata]|uniref:Uncharacterized protein n=1 Tax=Mycena maculata TaxID=230809 RepID=A0AAD7HJ05_9AGAR|nr:hypothetical protein DFH07DRAFT_972224 [Mycena maculata]
MWRLKSRRAPPPISIDTSSSPASVPPAGGDAPAADGEVAAPVETSETLRRDVLVVQRIWRSIARAGISAFFGLDVAILCLPPSNYAAKIVGGAQDNLTKARDERVALMNEVLGGILKARILIYGCTDGASLGTLECNACPGEIGYISSFYRRTRTSITFTSIIVFNEEYLSTPEATLAPPLANHSQTIAFQSCTVA